MLNQAKNSNSNSNPDSKTLNCQLASVNNQQRRSTNISIVQVSIDTRVFCRDFVEVRLLKKRERTRKQVAVVPLFVPEKSLPISLFPRSSHFFANPTSYVSKSEAHLEMQPSATSRSYLCVRFLTIFEKFS